MRDALDRLAGDGRAGRVVREGRMVVILGRPNAGKSSLFNALVGAARAIVTEVPGTTRDLLTERVDIDGVPVTLVDTAGLRDAGDAIEAEGVSRARQARDVAALTVVVVDGSTPLSADSRRLIAESAPAGLIVVSKVDLPRQWEPAELETKREQIVRGVGADGRRTRPPPAPHRRGARATARSCAIRPRSRTCATSRSSIARATTPRRAEAALAAGATEELVLTDLVAARRALEEITGRRTPEDLLAHIFGKFCIGK